MQLWFCEVSLRVCVCQFGNVYMFMQFCQCFYECVCVCICVIGKYRHQSVLVHVGVSVVHDMSFFIQNEKGCLLHMSASYL